MTKPIFVVVNAFSKQGFSIINTLLEDGKYKIRGTTTRSIDDNQAALKLKERGVDLFQVDVTKKSDFNRAFKGATAAFLMTPSIDYGDIDYPKKEFEYTKLQADAALEEKLKHVIFSSVDTAILTDEQRQQYQKYDIITCRTDTSRYIDALPFQYVSTFNLGYFYSNSIEFLPLIKHLDGSVEFTLPYASATDKLPYIDTYTATGPIVLEFLKNPGQYNRATVPLVSEFLSGAELAATFQKVTGIPAKFRTLNREEYIELSGWSSTPELRLMGNRYYEVWETLTKFDYYYKHRNIHLANEINPNQLTWEKFLIKTKWRGESFKEFKEKNGY